MARGPRVKKARRLRRGGESEPCRCLPAWTALAGSPINLCSRTQIGHITPSPRTNANEARGGGAGLSDALEEVRERKVRAVSVGDEGEVVHPVRGERRGGGGGGRRARGARVARRNEGLGQRRLAQSG